MNIQTVIDSIKNDAILNNLASFFQNEIYLVGGGVRDIFEGKEFTDRDLIVTDEDAGNFSEKISKFFDGVLIPLDIENKIYRVVLPDKINYLDITNPIENDLTKDVMRRDLTMNAIAIDIRSGKIPEICQSFLEDLENGLIRGISEENFRDDPLRLLRIFRFYSTTGYKIDENLLSIAKKYSNLISIPAKERVEYELMKLFNGKYSSEAILKMDEVGILELLFPFVSELKQVPPNSHHHLNLFYHSVETVKQVEILYENSSKDVKSHLERIDFGGFPRLAHLKLAAFLHDIGKFSTWTIEPDTGRHRFIKHDVEGSKMCVPFLRGLCFSNKQIEYISYIIKKHIYPSSVVSSPDLNEKIMMRYIRHSNDNAIDNIIIAMADRLSAKGPEITEKMINDNISALNNLLNFYLSVKDSLRPLPKLLDGNDVMKILNIKPSEKLGKILDELKEAQISGDVETKEDAIKYLNEHFVNN